MRHSHPEYDVDNQSKGDGEGKCDQCGGRGVVYVPNSSPPVSMRCKCAAHKDTIYNMENGWKGLSNAEGLGDSISPLVRCTKSNMLITASIIDFRNHLKSVAMKMGPKWSFKVTSDSELVHIWLSRLSDNIMDPDYRGEPMPDESGLNRFVSFPRLLIIQLGVKVSSNKETPSVVQEAISLRYHIDMPTWIVDQPHCRLEEGHKSYSRNLMDTLKINEYHRLSVGKQTRSVQASSNIMVPSDTLEEHTPRIVHRDPVEENREQRKPKSSPFSEAKKKPFKY